MQNNKQNDLDKQSDKKNYQTRHLSILFILVPLVFLVWGFIGESGAIPIDDIAFMIQTAAIAIVSFAALWIYSFYNNTAHTPHLFKASVFLFLLWIFAMFAAIPKINTTWDGSPEQTYQMKIVKVEATNNASIKSKEGTKHKHDRCFIYLDQKYFSDEDVLAFKYDDCKSIRPNVDALFVKVKKGTLHMPWISEFSIIKDSDLYKTR